MYIFSQMASSAGKQTVATYAIIRTSHATTHSLGPLHSRCHQPSLLEVILQFLTDKLALNDCKGGCFPLEVQGISVEEDAEVHKVSADWSTVR